MLETIQAPKVRHASPHEGDDLAMMLDDISREPISRDLVEAAHRLEAALRLQPAATGD